MSDSTTPDSIDFVRSATANVENTVYATGNDAGEDDEGPAVLNEVKNHASSTSNGNGGEPTENNQGSTGASDGNENVNVESDEEDDGTPDELDVMHAPEGPGRQQPHAPVARDDEEYDPGSPTPDELDLI